MYRDLYKNKNTGESVMLWNTFINKEKHYFKDVTLTEEVNVEDYEPVQTDDNVGVCPTPYQLFGIECEKGWYPLLKPIIEYIDNYNKDKSKDEMIYIDQIKEKFGTLRFYVSGGTKELHDMIDKAEDESAHVCEICGSRKDVGTTLGWYITICRDCLTNRAKKGYSTKWHSYEDNNIYLCDESGKLELLESYDEYMNRLQKC